MIDKAWRFFRMGDWIPLGIPRIAIVFGKWAWELVDIPIDNDDKESLSNVAALSLLLLILMVHTSCRMVTQ